MEEVINIRLATEADVDAINRFYNSVYATNRDRVKFDWEFNSAPAGKSIYVMAESENEVIGTQCVIPYYLITAEHQNVLSAKSEDTLVSPKHRGKQIFERMYILLIEECKKRGIECIWGFTYATKPFQRLNFQIPFKSCLGLLVQHPLQAAPYFKGLSSSRRKLEKIKIDALMVYSLFKAKLKLAFISSHSGLIKHQTLLNSDHFNYLKYPNSFGLKLDDAFIGYRIRKNAYNQNYCAYEVINNGEVVFSIVYHITNQKVGYVIHVYVSNKARSSERKAFLKSSIAKTELQHCHVVRFWGFTHNLQNREEVELLQSCGFTFIDKGISFVWLKLNNQLHLDPLHFVLSRMASQGTD